MPLGAIGVLAFIVLAQVGAAAPAQIPIRIDFEAPPGCADVDSFYEGVLARMNRVRRARPGESAMRLVVRLTRLGGKVHGELHVSGEGGESDTRRVDGATCEEVVQVLSLTAALAIDPSVGIAPSAGPEKPAPVATPAPSPRLAPSPTAAPTPTPAPAPRVESPPEPAPAPPAAPAVVVAPAPPASAPSSPPSSAEPSSSSPPASGFELGAALVGAEIVSPFLSTGVRVSGRLATTIGDGLTPSVALGILFLPTDFSRSGDDVRIRFAALGLTGCPGWALRGRVEIEPCARFAVGLLAANDHSVTDPLPVDRSWWSAGALLRATTALGTSGFTLEIAGGVDVPLIKRSFVITTPAHSVGATPTVSPAVSLGIGHRL